MPAMPKPPFECNDHEYIGLLRCTEVRPVILAALQPVYRQFQDNLAGEGSLLAVEEVNGKIIENRVFPAPK